MQLTDEGAKAANRMRLEGIVSKRRDAAYRSGKRCDWIKVKCENLAGSEERTVATIRSPPLVEMLPAPTTPTKAKPSCHRCSGVSASPIGFRVGDRCVTSISEPTAG